MADCAVANCTRPAQARDPLCAAHRKRLQRGQGTGAPIAEQLDPFERALQAGIELADCDSGDDAAYERAVDRFRKACERWAVSLRQSAAGRARWKGVGARDRAAAMRLLVLRRWAARAAARATDRLVSGTAGRSEGVRGRGQDGEREGKPQTPEGNLPAGSRAEAAGVGDRPADARSDLPGDRRPARDHQAVGARAGAGRAGAVEDNDGRGSRAGAGARGRAR